MRNALAALAVVLVSMVAARAGAQTPRLEQEVDSLARLAAEARGAVRAHDDSVKRSVRAADTAYAGTPTIVAERSVVPRTRVVAPVVVDSVASVTGAAMSRLVGFTFRVHGERRVNWNRAGDTTRELVVSVHRPNGAEMRAWRSPADSASIAAALQYAMTYMVFAASDPAFFAWAGSVIPGDTLNASEWANQRLLLVSSASAVAGRCYRGDIQACRTALMLMPGSDPILDWHDSTTRRRLVRRHGALARRLDARAEQQCLGGSDASCVSLLQLFPSGTFREPTAVALRSAFLRHALAVGGAGAVERLLVANSGSPTTRLEAAAQLPVDSLIGRWQMRVRETRAPSQDLTVGIAIMSVAWAAGMGALSLRSSRWR
jgi:hypothetical protein